MDDKTLLALRASIEAWKLKAVTDDPYVRIGSSTCPLCQLFNNGEQSSEDRCRGCPVWEKTGKTGCKGSPYDDAAVARSEWQDAAYVKRLYPHGANISEAQLKKSEWMMAADKEVAFLQSLYDEELERRVELKKLELPKPLVLDAPEPVMYTFNIPLLQVGESYTITVRRSE